MKTPNKILVVVALLSLLLGSIPPRPAHAAGGADYYVTPDGTFWGNYVYCGSWENSCTLSKALSRASSSDEIWVMKGTHTPTSTDSNHPEAGTFQLKSGVAIYGGFVGNETSLGQRNWVQNETVLSGDLQGNDNSNVSWSEPTRQDNANNVVTGSGTDNTAILDGFKIYGGNTSGYPNWTGGGMYNNGGSPTLRNIVFSANSSNSDGGGMYNENSNPVLINVTFTGNAASGGGGGMYNQDSSPSMSSVAFFGNTSHYLGGGIYSNRSNFTLFNATFSGNTASSSSDGLFIDNSNPQLNHVTLNNGMYLFDSTPFIKNSIMLGSYLYVTSAATIKDSIRPDGCPGNANCTNLIAADPLLGPIGYYRGSSSLTFSLLPGSPAIDAGGVNSVCATEDQTGWPRTGACDIGAFESAGFYLERMGGILNWKQSAKLDALFALPLEVRVASLYNEPVNGGKITFAGPSSGASTNPVTQTVTITNGFAGAYVTANNLPGYYKVTAGAAGVFLTEFYLGNINNIFYVKPDGSETADCFSWANACTLGKALQDAIIPGVEIWVAAGTYKPSLNEYYSIGVSREYTFKLREGVGLYGGFAGTETERSQRNLVANQTILSGDIGIAGDNSDNVYHVVTGTDGAILDGFIVTAGNANGGSLNLKDIGGGMLNFMTSPIIENVTFLDNSADEYGGGMYNHDNSVTVSGVTFDGNSAGAGGGMLNYNTTLSFSNVTFANNTATTYGGGGMANFDATITLANATFSGNTSNTVGGAIYNMPADMTIRNTIFWNNTATQNNPNIVPGSGDVSVYNSVLYWLGPGGNNTTADPLLGAYDYHGGFTRTFALLPGSSAINTGDNAYCPEADQRGTPRPQPVGGTCDMGAYEYVDTTAPTITAFNVITPSTHDIPITTFTASDNFGVIGYMITESATPPLSSALGWTSVAPVTYSVTSDGTYTLYPWAKDATGNISAVFGSPRTVEVETVKPTVDSFTVQSFPNSLTVDVTTFDASDGVGSGINGYMITQSVIPPLAGQIGWFATAPTSVTLSGDGTYTLYPWVRDAAGNISDVFYAPITVTLDANPPTVLAFTIDAITTGYTVSVTEFNATDFNDPVEAYLITLSATPPLPDDIGWLATAPTTFSLPGDGVYSLYPWAKDETGKVSPVFLSPPEVTVDLTPPNLTVPANMTLEATDSSGAVVTFTVTASDAVDAAPAILCAPSTGSTFPLGITTVICEATDDAGNTAADAFDITVEDTTAPIVDVPAGITAEAASASGAVVSFTMPTATDLVAPANPSVTCDANSGSTFPLGTTTVTCEAIDDAGNIGRNSFDIKVEDTTAPSMNVPADMTAEAGVVVTFTVTASDAVDTDPTIVCTPPSGSTFPLGTTTVNCSATDDAGNTASDTFDITTGDTTAPVLNLPANKIVPQTIPAGAVVTYTASASDLVDGTVSVSCSPASGSTFPLGTTTVNCSASDTHGNVANGSFTVTVRTSRNLLSRPDFTGPYVFPYPWKLFGVTPPYNLAMDCKIFQSNPCSVYLTGDSKNTFKAGFQLIRRSGQAGDRYAFGISSRARYVPSGGLYQVQATFYDGLNKVVGRRVLRFRNGTHGFQLASGYVTAPAAYTHIELRFIFQKTGGQAWFDDAFLYRVP